MLAFNANLVYGHGINVRQVVFCSELLSQMIGLSGHQKETSDY